MIDVILFFVKWRNFVCGVCVSMFLNVVLLGFVECVLFSFVLVINLINFDLNVRM